MKKEKPSNKGNELTVKNNELNMTNQPVEMIIPAACQQALPVIADIIMRDNEFDEHNTNQIMGMCQTHENGLWNAAQNGLVPVADAHAMSMEVIATAKEAAEDHRSNTGIKEVLLILAAGGGGYALSQLKGDEIAAFISNVFSGLFQKRNKQK